MKLTNDLIWTPLNDGIHRISSQSPKFLNDDFVVASINDNLVEVSNTEFELNDNFKICVGKKRMWIPEPQTDGLWAFCGEFHFGPLTHPTETIRDVVWVEIALKEKRREIWITYKNSRFRLDTFKGLFSKIDIEFPY